MSKIPLIWIIDEEWADYDVEKKILTEVYGKNVDIRYSSYDYEKDLKDFGTQADAILAQVYVQIPKTTIDQLDNCKIIAVYGGGYDRIDIQAARKRNIAVTNVSGYCAEDLADYVMAGIYYYNKQIEQYSSNLSSGRWGAQATDRIPKRIRGSILHVIGLGRIGKTVAAKAQNLGMQVTAFDPYISAEEMMSLSIKKTEWVEGLKEADFISVNAILTPETTGLITLKDLRLLKPGTCLINTARGKIINEEDLVKSLDEGSLSQAILDVISHEPPRLDEPIFRAKNCLVTPHISYISRQSYDELKQRATSNVITHLNGEISPDLVNGV